MDKISNTLFLFVAVFFLYSCSTIDAVEEKTGLIVMEVATRGSHQYLIKVDEEFFWPENLPEQFKIPELEVKVKYRKKEGSKIIYKPAPNDVPIQDYTVPIITILNIKEIK